MQTLVEATPVKPCAPEVVGDEKGTTITVQGRTDSQLVSGWDAFEVWRTRVKAQPKTSKDVKRT